METAKLESEIQTNLPEVFLSNPKKIKRLQMIKRIMLIRPGKYPEGMIAPLGLLYLASFIEQKLPQIEIQIV